MTYPYWSHDGDAFEFHDTAEQARARAEEALAWHRALADRDDEWADEVEQVAWGTVTQRARVVSRTTDDDGETVGVEYGLIDVVPDDARTEK